MLYHYTDHYFDQTLWKIDPHPPHSLERHVQQFIRQYQWLSHPFEVKYYTYERANFAVLECERGDLPTHHVLSQTRLHWLDSPLQSMWRDGEDFKDTTRFRRDLFDIAGQYKKKITVDGGYGVDGVIGNLRLLDPGNIFVSPSHILPTADANLVLVLAHYFGFPIKEDEIGVKSLKPLFIQREAMLVY